MDQTLTTETARASATVLSPRGAIGSGARHPFRILIASDAWQPQVNGVVRTLEGLVEAAPRLGANIAVLTPDGHPSVPMPGYPEIRLSLAGPRRIAQEIEDARPNAIHIATEGPIGFWVRRYCMAERIPFTTCYHTRYPEYLAARLPVPLAASYGWLRRFHNAGHGTMVATAALKAELEGRGFEKLLLWKRGVATDVFSQGRQGTLHLPRPIFLCVARVAVEKNIEAFLELDLPGSKVVVGDGPARADLQRRFPKAVFLGVRTGRELADVYASSDAFVFPSRTDTFGLVLLEALAAGLPVAAFPVQGPRDILAGSGCGAMADDLRMAALAALTLPRERCKLFAASRGIAESTRSFIDNVRTALLQAEPSAGFPG